MGKVLWVAIREFKATVLTKAFIFGIIGVPILMVGVMIIAGVIMAGMKEPPLVGKIALVGAPEDVAASVREQFDAERIKARQDAEAAEHEAPEAEQLERMMGTPQSMEEAGENPFGSVARRGEVNVEVQSVEGDPDADFSEEEKEQVRGGDLLAVVKVSDDAVTRWKPPAEGEEGAEDWVRPTFQLLASDEMDSDHVELIKDVVGEAIVAVRADRLGVDLSEAKQIMREPRAATNRISDTGATKEEGEIDRVLKQVLPIFLLMLLWISTFAQGNHLLMSTIEEKSNKVMEVLLSAVSPTQLMAGKILGQGAAVMIVVAVYSVVGAAGLIALQQAGIISPMDLVVFSLFFFMAYFMVASMMAAVGSAVSDLREANSLLTPVMMILMIPLFLWMPISQAPNGMLAQAFSFLPPAIPFVMILRVGSDEGVAPHLWWQIPGTIVWGYLCMAGMVWMAGKIFRVGVLMTGKPPSPLELFRWIRYS